MEQPTWFACAACGEEFSTRQQLELHLREKHPQSDVRQSPQLQLQERPQSEDPGEVF